MLPRTVTFTSEQAAVLMAAEATQQLGITESNEWVFDILLSPEGKVRFVVTFDPPTDRATSSSTHLLDHHPAEEADAL